MLSKHVIQNTDNTYNNGVRIIVNHTNLIKPNYDSINKREIMAYLDIIYGQYYGD